MSENKIFEFLPAGQNNAISLDDLAQLFGMDKRGVRAEVERERNAGCVILSSASPTNGGYFRPGSIEELERFVRMMESRRKHLEASTASARELLAEMKAGR